MKSKIAEKEEKSYEEKSCEWNFKIRFVSKTSEIAQIMDKINKTVLNFCENKNFEFEMETNIVREITIFEEEGEEDGIFGEEDEEDKEYNDHDLMVKKGPRTPKRVERK